MIAQPLYKGVDINKKHLRLIQKENIEKTSFCNGLDHEL